MFSIRVFAPPAPFDTDLSQVTGTLIVGDARLGFRLDLRRWRVSDYQYQWKAGIDRLARGAASSALMTAYRDDDPAPHLMWALWRDAGRIHVQPHCVLPSELTARFNPFDPYAHIGSRIPATEESLPIPEWSVDLDRFLAAALHIRWPFDQ